LQAAPFPYLGEILSFLTAILWASAVILFKKSGENTHPVALNLFKNSVAFVLILLTMFVLKIEVFRDLPLKTYLITMASGLIGIGIADSLFFRSLNILGAGRSAIVDSLYSPFVILFSYIWLGERLNWLQGFGALLVVGAVLIATYEKQEQQLERKRLIEGTIWAIISHAMMAIGLIMIKRILEAEPLLWVTEWRIIGGLLGLIVILSVYPNRIRVLKTLIVKGSKRYTIIASIVGAYLVLMTWLGGMKYTQASIASALNQTSTILLFILAAIILKEKVTKRKSLSIMIAIAGAVLVTFG
jgi:drug/metabolite transporter (DMT)-like permease